MSRPKLSEHEIVRVGERGAVPLPRSDAKPELRSPVVEAAANERPRNVGGRLMV
jgi:hypothetical protein